MLCYTLAASYFLPLLSEVMAGPWLTAPEREKLLLALVAGVGYVGKMLLDWVQEWRAARKKAKHAKGHQTLDKYRMLSAKDVEINNYAEQIRLTTACDHVSVYGALNGEYFRSGDSIEKLLLQGEAAPVGEPRFMHTEERLVYTNTMPYLIHKLCLTEYVLLWPGQCEDELANRNMRRRGYKSSLAMLITVPAPTGYYVLGLLSLSWRHITLSPVKEQCAGEVQAWVTPKLQADLRRFRIQLGDVMIRKDPPAHNE